RGERSSTVGGDSGRGLPPRAWPKRVSYRSGRPPRLFSGAGGGAGGPAVTIGEAAANGAGIVAAVVDEIAIATATADRSSLWRFPRALLLRLSARSRRRPSRSRRRRMTSATSGPVWMSKHLRRPERSCPLPVPI